MPRLVRILIVSAALAAGLYVSISMNEPALPPVHTTANIDLVGSLRPDFRLGSSTGAFVTPADFTGKTLLINFWATWCAPCLKEMPMLMDLQAEYGEQGLQVIGIALDDVQRVRDYIEELGIDYPILVGAVDVIETNRDYGNLTGLLPYSVLVDKEGIIQWQYSGIVESEVVRALLDQHL